MASTKQRLECLQDWLYSLDIQRKRNGKNNPKKNTKKTWNT